MSEGSPGPAENSLVIPPTWLRRLHPRRGGLAVPEVTVGEVDGPLLDDQAREWIEAALGAAGSEPEAVDAVRRHLGGEANPLGAAAIVSILVKRTGAGFERVIERFTDSWIAGHGLAFAALALTELVPLRLHTGWSRHGSNDPKAIGYLQAEENVYALWRARDVPRKVRALLAVAGDDEYEDAIKQLADHRWGPLRQAMASYLVPTRDDWVEECCAVLASANLRYSGWMLWCSLASERHAALAAAQAPLWPHEAPIDVLATILEGTGSAVAPHFAELLDGDWVDADTRKLFLQVLAMLPTDEAFGCLVDRLDRPYVVAATASAAKRFPARALRMLASASGGTSKSSLLAGDLLSAHVPAHPELVVDELPEQLRAKVEAVAASMARLPDAPVEELPRVLAEPPWVTRRKSAKPMVVAGLTPPDLRSASWEPGEREAWAAEYLGRPPWWNSDPIETRLERFDTQSLSGQVDLVLAGPEEIVVPLLQGWVPKDMWYPGRYIRSIVARFGLDALPLALRAAKAGPTPWGHALLPLLDAEVATLQASWLMRLKAARKHAIAWFDRHGLEAAVMLIPAAVGKPGVARSNAEGALRHIATREALATAHGDTRAKRTQAETAEAVVEVARRFGEEAAQAIAALLAADPLEILPARVPKVPDWVDPRALPQVLLRDRAHGLPVEATRHLLTMLALSKPDETYPGVAIVRDICDPASLAEFSRALFRLWQSHHWPSKENWLLTQLGLLGDSETVRLLAPIVRVWPGEGGHARAVQGLDVLAAIGTDVALLHLHGISQKVKFKGLKTKAQERIEQIAADLELTSEQLADRLVPDFGLDADGSLTLDYGPRRFTVGFDEQLKPYVLDEDGKRRKALPKPGAKDDEAKAPDAYKRFAGLKKDVRTVAADQIRRFEQAMVQARRWPVNEFRDLFVSHPLVWHIVRRLVWSARTPGTELTFRLAEDRTYTNVDDDTITLQDGAVIAIPHPLDLGDSTAQWSELFADYEILQPFPQLGRAVHTLTDEERATDRLTRFEGATVPVGKVLGLQHRGWQRGKPQDGGVEPWISKEVSPGLHVTIDLDPGVIVGYTEEFGEQTLTGIVLTNTPDRWRRKDGTTTFDTLSPAIASELLADLIDLTT